MEGPPGVGGVPSSPLRGASAASSIRDRQARRESGKRFDAALDGEAEAVEPDEEPAPPRRAPHPPPDEDSGNQLDVIA